MFILEVIKALGEHRVKYAVVGGYAVALHGAVRGTIDVDIVVSLDLASFTRAEEALQSLGLNSRLPLNAEEVFNFREEYIANKNLIAWSFVNPDQPNEQVDIVITEDFNGIATVTKKVAGTSIRIAAIEDLIRMKEKSGRQQDVEDVRALRRLS